VNPVSVFIEDSPREAYRGLIICPLSVIYDPAAALLEEFQLEINWCEAAYPSFVFFFLDKLEELIAVHLWYTLMQ